MGAKQYNDNIDNIRAIIHLLTLQLSESGAIFLLLTWLNWKGEDGYFNVFIVLVRKQYSQYRFLSS